MAWSEPLDFSGQTLSLWSAPLDFSGETLSPGSVTLVDPLAEAGKRITAIPDLAAGDILQWYNVVGGADSDVQVFSNGTFESARAVTAFDVRADDGVDVSAWVTQTVGPPAVNALSFQMRANVDGVGVPRGIWAEHALTAASIETGSPEIGVPVFQAADNLVAGSILAGIPVLGTPVAGVFIDGDNATQFNAILNGRVAPFAYEVAADPVITNTVTVNPTTINDPGNLSTNGRRLILQAGAYGGFTVSGNDREIVLEAGVTTGQIVINGCNRLRIVGIPEREHSIHCIRTQFGQSMTDVALIGLNIVGVGTLEGVGYENALDNFNRVLIMRTYIDMVGHSLLMSTGIKSNIILAKTYVYQNRQSTNGVGSTQAGPRGNSIDRWLNVDCRFRNENSSGGSSRQCWRAHATTSLTENIWATGCIFAGTAIQLQPQVGTSATFPMRDIWFDGNDWYPVGAYDGLTVNIVGNGTTLNPYPTDVRWLNNRVFTAAGSNFSTPSGVGWTVSNNQQLPAQALPEWSWT